MYLYYDIIDEKKLITVISDKKLEYLGDRYVEKDKKDISETGILYLDELGNILVKEDENIERKVSEIKKSLDTTSLMFAEAQLETTEKQGQSEKFFSQAIVEVYGEIAKINEKLEKITNS